MTRKAEQEEEDEADWTTWQMAMSPVVLIVSTVSFFISRQGFLKQKIAKQKVIEWVSKQYFKVNKNQHFLFVCQKVRFSMQKLLKYKCKAHQKVCILLLRVLANILSTHLLIKFCHVFYYFIIKENCIFYIFSTECSYKNPKNINLF